MTTTNPTGRDPGHAHEAEVEAAARALCDAHYGADCWDNTRVGSERHGVFQRKATTALAAALPLIRERLAQEVIDGCDHGAMIGIVTCSRCMRAARIVRGDAS